MSRALGAAGRAVLLGGALALAGCGPGAEFRAPPEAEILPASGALRPAVVSRLLLIDAARMGGRVVAVGAHGYIVVTDDDGASWKRAAAPDAPLLTAVDFPDAKNGWAVGHDAVILATADGGDTWTRQFSAPAEQRPLLDVLMLDSAHGIAVGAYGAYYETADGGRSWSARKIIPEDRHFNAVLRIDLAGARDARKLIIVGEEGTILVSSNDGADWKKVASPYKGSLFGGVVAADGSVVVFGLRGRIYRSADAGETWKQVDNASSATLMGGSRLPDGTIVITGAAGIALASRDNGQSFVPLDTGTARVFSKAILGAPNMAMLLGEGGARAVALHTARAAKPR